MHARTKYILKDGMNGYTVCLTDDIRIAKSEASEYDDGCEGDWLPCLYMLHEDNKYHLCEDFKF